MITILMEIQETPADKMVSVRFRSKGASDSTPAESAYFRMFEDTARKTSEAMLSLTGGGSMVQVDGRDLTEEEIQNSVKIFKGQKGRF